MFSADRGFLQPSVIVSFELQSHEHSGEFCALHLHLHREIIPYCFCQDGKMLVAQIKNVSCT